MLCIIYRIYIDGVVNIMRKVRLLAVSLVATLVVGVVSPMYHTKVHGYEVEETNMNPLVTGLSEDYIKILDDCSIESDLVMLDDIIERSYRNDFSIKSYIIKTDDSELDGTLWNIYLHSRGAIQTTAFWDRNGVVEATDSEGNTVYYHSITAKPRPEWDLQYYDDEKRKYDETLWNSYMEGIREAEVEMGYFEGNNLCDYQLMIQVYGWLADHLYYAEGVETDYPDLSGQQAFHPIIRKKMPACAGYARLFNQFMHDFGIDSYYVSNKSIEHANNFVKLGDYYYGAEVDCATLNVINDYYKKYNQNAGPLSYNYNNMFCSVSQHEDEISALNEFSAITAYNKNVFNFNQEDFMYVVEPRSTITEDGMFEKQSMYGKDCVYCGETHCYSVNDNVVVNNFSDKIVDKSYIFKASYRYFDEGSFSFIYEPSFDIYEGTVDNEGQLVVSKHLSEGLDNGEEQTTKGETTTPETVVPTSPVETSTNQVETSTSIVETSTNTVETATVEETEPEVTTEQPTTAKVEETTTTKISTTTKSDTTTTKPEQITSKNTATVKTPKKPTSVKVVNKKTKKIKVTWKASANAKKYQVQWSTSKKFKKATTKKTKNLKYTIKKLTKGKTYYIRVRGINGKKVGKWSSVKKVKIKK